MQLRSGGASSKGAEGWTNQHHEIRNSLLEEFDVVANSLHPMFEVFRILKVIKNLLKNGECRICLVGSCGFGQEQSNQ
jgi:hypothetical protein